NTVHSMNAATDALPHILFEPTMRRVPAGLEHMDLHELRKRAQVWLGPGLGRLPRDQLVAATRKALEDDAAAGRVQRWLSPLERAVAAVYRRYGGSVDGEVIRLDLMARGLLEIVEQRRSDFYTERKWKHDAVRSLASSWVLISERPDLGYYYMPLYLPGP